MDDSGINQNNLGLLMRALTFAADKHRNQRRKGVEQHPYVNHPIALADILVNEGGITDIEIICAALLHDVIEDCEVREEDLAAEFGPAVAELVAEVTDDKSLPKDERKRRQVEKAPTLSHGAALIKLADKIANLRDILNAPPADWDAERKRKYYEWAKEVIDGLRGTHEALEAVFDETCSHGLPRRSPNTVSGGDGERTIMPQDGQTGKGRKRPLKLSYVTAEDPIYSLGPAIGGRRLKPSSASGQTGSEKDLKEMLAEQVEEGLRRQGSSSERTDEQQEKGKHND